MQRRATEDCGNVSDATHLSDVVLINTALELIRLATDKSGPKD